jgi:hypothetical protein
MKTIALLTIAALASCATPPAPTPTPTPTPTDALAGVELDCEASWVEAEHATGSALAESCLTRDDEDFTGCLAQVATAVHPDTVGCEVRDLGAQVSAKVAAGTASAVEMRTALRVRSWIRAEKVSYRRHSTLPDCPSPKSD